MERIKARPELSKKFPAIDGLPDSQGLTVRPDIAGILELSDDEFEQWYQERFDAVSSMLAQIRLIGSVPSLAKKRVEREEDETMASFSEFYVLLEDLEEAMGVLELIARIRKEDLG